MKRQLWNLQFNTALILVALCINANAKEVYATFDVEATKTANLAFSYSGIVNEVLVDVNSIVKKGEVLANLQSDDLIATNIISKITMKYAELDLARYKELRKKNLIDKSQLDKFALAYESIRAQIEFEETIYAKTILHAPFDGIIVNKLIEVGDVVSGQVIKTAFIIQSEHSRKLILEFDQKYNNDVKTGNAFTYTIDGDETKYHAKITKIYPRVNVDNRKIKAEVEVEDVLVGLFGEGTIQTQVQSN